MPRLNEAQRNQAVGMIRAGVSQNEVSRRFGVHRNKISALWRRYQQSGNTRDCCRSGRPRVTSLQYSSGGFSKSPQAGGEWIRVERIKF